jgi:Gpi18-like mannosyltransferase
VKVRIKSKMLPVLLIILGLFFVSYVRFLYFSVESSDAYLFILPWYDFISQHGLIHAFAYNFYNYNPPYLYLIGLTTLVTWLPKLVAIKLISVVFDFVAAIAAYHLVLYKKKDCQWAWLAFFAVLLSPAVFIESGLWAQCDIIYTAFLLWMLDALLQEKYIRGLVFFSIAFVFKFQAVFLAPIILYLLIKRKLPIYSLVYPLGIYFLSLLPAWLAGRSLRELISIYFSQANFYKSLSMNAPSLYYPWRGEAFYSTTTVLIGLGIAALFTSLYLLMRCKKPVFQSTEIFFYDACLLTFFIPFLTPKMHERFFFPAVLFFSLQFSLTKKPFVCQSCYKFLSCSHTSIIFRCQPSISRNSLLP